VTERGADSGSRKNYLESLDRIVLTLHWVMAAQTTWDKGEANEEEEQTKRGED